jgi:hypothetical protein
MSVQNDESHTKYSNLGPDFENSKFRGTMIKDDTKMTDRTEALDGMYPLNMYG